MKTKPAGLWFEFAGLYVGIPAALVVFQLRGGVPFFPVLFGFLLLTLLLGWRDPGVAFRAGKSRPSTPGERRGRGLDALPFRLLGVGGFLCLFTWIFYPQLFFRFPREQPRIWMLVMLLYPLLSVAPQEYLFRTFFMQRYRPLFGEGFWMVAVNALVFGWAHAFFLNWVAPLLSIPAGWLLARSWQQTRSFKRVCMEHALYGQIVFTCGIGWFFYQGSTRALEHLAR